MDALRVWLRDQPTGFQEIIDTLTNPMVIVGVFMLLSESAAGSGGNLKNSHPLFPAAVWIAMLKVRNQRRRNLHKETLKELQQLRADKKYLMAAQGGSTTAVTAAAAGGRKASRGDELDDDEA